MILGPGNRVPQAMQSQLRAMAQSGLIVPSVVSYVQYVEFHYGQSARLTELPVSLTLGRLEIIHRRSIVCIDISTTPCKAEIAHCTNMPC